MKKLGLLLVLLLVTSAYGADMTLQQATHNEGRDFKSAVDNGVFIWYNSGNAEWSICWNREANSDSTKYFVVKAKISSNQDIDIVTPLEWESTNDHWALSADKKTITVDALVGGGYDGIEFKQPIKTVGDTTFEISIKNCLRTDPTVCDDELATPDQVFIGTDKLNPPKMPVSIESGGYIYYTLSGTYEFTWDRSPETFVSGYKIYYKRREGLDALNYGIEHGPQYYAQLIGNGPDYDWLLPWSGEFDIPVSKLEDPESPSTRVTINGGGLFVFALTAYGGVEGSITESDYSSRLSVYRPAPSTPGNFEIVWP